MVPATLLRHPDPVASSDTMHRAPYGYAPTYLTFTDFIDETYPSFSTYPVDGVNGAGVLRWIDLRVAAGALAR